MSPICGFTSEVITLNLAQSREIYTSHQINVLQWIVFSIFSVLCLVLNGLMVTNQHRPAWANPPSQHQFWNILLISFETLIDKPRLAINPPTPHPTKIRGSKPRFHSPRTTPTWHSPNTDPPCRTKAVLPNAWRLCRKNIFFSWNERVGLKSPSDPSPAGAGVVESYLVVVSDIDVWVRERVDKRFVMGCVEVAWGLIVSVWGKVDVCEFGEGREDKKSNADVVSVI